MTSGTLEGAHDFVLNNPQLYDHSSHTKIEQVIHGTVGSGIQILLKASMPEAFHDSSARDSPPRCHPGTRLNFISKVAAWGADVSHQTKPILWMYGPAAVGKSAVAQSCAELLAEQNLLGAAVFFSRPNSRDDPKCLFTSISYQIATKTASFSNILDHHIHNDPTLVEKSITRQFYELLVKPLEELRARGEEMREYVIIVDGLDEVAGLKTQCDIVEIVAESVRDSTTPFRWAFFSRAESHILNSFTSQITRPLSRHLELPVSRDIDYEILCYLVAEFKRIREEAGLPSSWPSEQDVAALVDRSAGLFGYASTVVRFIGEQNSPGPANQLHAVLAPRPDNIDTDHPLSELDRFYMLIMQRVPSKVLLTVQKILLLDSLPSTSFLPVHLQVPLSANIFNLPETEVRHACAFLRSVLEFEPQSRVKIKYYHVSFVEFLQDPKRSKEFCVYGDCLDNIRQDLLERLNVIHSRSIDGSIGVGVTWPYPGVNEDRIYTHTVELFFRVCQLDCRPLDLPTVTGLTKFEFQMIPRLYKNQSFRPYESILRGLRRNIPAAFRDKIIRQSYNPCLYLSKPADATWDRTYILGQGKSRIVCWRSKDGSQMIVSHYPLFFYSRL